MYKENQKHQKASENDNYPDCFFSRFQPIDNIWKLKKGLYSTLSKSTPKKITFVRVCP